MSWTDERIERLKTLWESGLSASQIAADLGGVTRNAVMGKVSRLKLPERSKDRRIKQPRPPDCRLGRKLVSSRSHTPRLVFTQPRVVHDIAPPDAKFNCSMLGLKSATADGLPGTCRFPLGDPGESDFKFCGNPTSTTYCAYCHAVCHQPRDSRSRAA